MKTRLSSLEHLVLHELLLKMAAECEDAGVSRRSRGEES